MQDNIALSLEVATSYSVQITLIQMPALVFFSAFYSEESSNSFTLIFQVSWVFLKKKKRKKERKKEKKKNEF